MENFVLYKREDWNGPHRVYTPALNGSVKVGKHCYQFTTILYHLKLNTMQLVTPVGNHCCIMANDVHN